MPPQCRIDAAITNIMTRGCVKTFHNDTFLAFAFVFCSPIALRSGSLSVVPVKMAIKTANTPAP